MPPGTTRKHKVFVPLLLGPRLRRHPGQQQPRQVSEGQLVFARPTQDQPVGTIDALILVLVAGVGAWQAAASGRRQFHRWTSSRLACSAWGFPSLLAGGDPSG